VGFLNSRLQVRILLGPFMSKIILQSQIEQTRELQRNYFELEKDIQKSIRNVVRSVNQITIDLWNKTFSDWPLFRCYCDDPRSIFQKKGPFEGIDFMAGSMSKDWQFEPLTIEPLYDLDKLDGIPQEVWLSSRGWWKYEFTENGYDLEPSQSECTVPAELMRKFISELSDALGIRVELSKNEDGKNV
jgi:hypothetical protein